MITNPLTQNINAMQPTSYFSNVIRVFFTFLIIMAAVFFFFNFIWGGIEWIGSGGDKNKLEEARGRVVNSIIGLLIVFSLYMILNFLNTIFNIDLLGFNFSMLQL